ncbi:MAG: SMP-30/gluconolactonase/LRE family protein [Pseudolabrys sp.]
MVSVECIVQTDDVLGEVPLWHPTENALYWIDLFKPAIHRLQILDRRVKTWTPPEKLGSFALRAEGGLLIAGRSGLSLFDPSNGHLDKIIDPEADNTENILNDGRCDRRGRFWVGSMNKMLTHASGRLYRFEQQRLDVVAKGIWVPNSICWSPDDRRMYFADSHLRTIFAYEFDIDSGTIGGRQEFACMESIPGVPDGSSVDSEGFLWNAVFDGGCLVRYAPDGRTDRVVPLPVSRPSACTFGGPDLATLYVTTARFRLPPEKLATEPYAGGLLAIDVGVKGLPEPFFAG